MGHKNLIDLTGKRFGKWTVLERAPNKNGHTYFFCKCDCGSIHSIYSFNLSSGKSNSCLTCGNTTHGMSNTKTYNIWIQMLERCHNPKHKYYSYYGGRRIYVCSRWRKSFENFLMDMGIAPENLSIDRIDNNQGYSKNNCRWTTKTKQQRNRRNSINIGEINSGWTVLQRGLKKKTWVIQCFYCGYTLSVRACNYRRRHPHNCKEKNYED